MKINKKLTIEKLIKSIKKGKKKFKNIEISWGNLMSSNLEQIIFNECILAIDFTGSNLRGSQFLNSNLKTSIFKNTDLTDAKFKNNILCGAVFKGAKIDNIIFENNHYHSVKVSIDDLKEMI